jgi:hypothetical protein
MATMIDGESYMGRVLIRPLSQAGDLRLYLWPLRCLKSRMGGPTFGIEVKGEEILRFDAHGPRGHWHKGGYDKLGAGGSHQDFPEGVVETASQLSWSLGYLRAHAQELLTEAGYPTAGRIAGPRAALLGLRRRAGARGAGRRSPHTRHRPRTAGGLTVPPSSRGPCQLGAACARRAARAGPAPCGPHR